MSNLVQYLQSFQGHFWQYEDGGKIIAIPGGNTIGYREVVLEEIVVYLAPQGLPRFGALLLAIIATNPNGRRALDTVADRVHAVVGEHSDIEQALAFARLLAEVPTEYKKGKLRIELLRAVFQGAHNALGESDSTRIARELESSDYFGRYPGILRPLPLNRNKILTDLRALSLLSRELTSVSAILERITDLAPLSEPLAELEFSEEDTPPTDLVTQLTEDYRTFYVGALVERLIGGLNIPPHADLPGPQPLGGVADITNKGNFDRLLVSELAFDDTVLLSRLANNEALYHHREIPPADHERPRTVIIDVSLKNWGNVRTIALATMVALLHHPKHKRPSRVFVVGNAYDEVDGDTVEGIVAATQVLDPSIDASTGLTALFKNEGMDKNEVFYIGSPEPLATAAMQKFNAAYGRWVDHWIHPYADGRVVVYKNAKSGKRFVRALRLPLNQAWEHRPPPAGKKPAEPESTPRFYPILFPCSKRKTTWTDGEHHYAVFNQSALLRHYGNDNDATEASGWEMMVSDFPRNDQLLAVMTHENLSVTLLVADHYDKIMIWHPESGERLTVEGSMRIQRQWRFQVRDDHFVGLHRGKSYWIDLNGRLTIRDEKMPVVRAGSREWQNLQAYRNVERVAVTQRGTLRIGKHELSVNNFGLSLRHDPRQKNDISVLATMRINDTFEFPDGSRIEHDRNGMLTLVSSLPTLSKVYVPCVLNNSLGAATDAVFAGNPYYRMKRRIVVVFEDAGEHRLKLMQSVVKLGPSLKDAKEAVLNRRLVLEKAERMDDFCRELDELGITHHVRYEGIEQREIGTVEFYETYIQAFIDKILGQDGA